MGVSLVLGFAVPACAEWVWTPQIKRFVNLKRLPKETPELQVEYARSLMVAEKYKDAFRETKKFDDFYADTEYADDNQFVRGEIRMAQGNPLAAAKEFQKVVANYPGSNLFDQVIAKQYEIGDRLYAKGQANLEKRWKRWHFLKKKPLKQAIDVYSMVIENQPFTDAAAAAQYKIGLCHQTRKEYRSAEEEYKRVIEDYMSSDWVDEASYSLAICYCDESLTPQYDQSISELAVRAIDNFKTRYASDARTAELETKRAEMRERIAAQRLMTAQFYEKRRDFKPARIYYEVVVEQFPDTSAAEQAKAWLAANPAPAKP